MSPQVRNGLRFVWEAWRPHRRFLPLLAALTLISSAVATAYPLVLKRVIDGLQSAADAGTAPALGPPLLILGLIAIGRIAAHVYPAVRAWVNFRIAASVRSRVFEQVMKGAHDFRARFASGDVLTRLTDDLEEFPKAAWFCCSGIFRAVESSSKVLFAVGVMLVLDPRLTLIALLPLPAMLYVFYRVQGRLAAAYDGQQKAISSTNDVFESAFTGVQTVKAFGTGPVMARRLAGILGDRAVHQLNVQRYWALFHIVDAFASRAGQVLTLVAGGLLAMRGDLTLGTLYAFYVYLDMLVHPLQDLPNLLISGRQAFASMERVEEIEQAAAPPERSAPSGATVAAKESSSSEPIESMPPLESTQAHAPSGASDSSEGAGASGPGAPSHVSDSPEEAKGPLADLIRQQAAGSGTESLQAPGGNSARIETLELRDLSCAYSAGGPPVLSSVSFSIERGERLAVVGTVGSGKSTLLCLLAGLLPPSSGSLLVNGNPLSFPVSERYRAMIGWVPQEALLFSAPIRWNVSLGREDAERLAEISMEVAQLGPDLALFPSGADTVLGSKGARISGGQRQRVAIARALARSPSLLLLDDSTASLDAESEDRFWAALDRHFPAMTTVVATHRLATVERAHRVLLLHAGQVLAIGTHDELRARIPGYSDLLCLGSQAA
ncbi:MAG: ABC transporter ATP-binding protein [Myxococcota bacterium]